MSRLTAEFPTKSGKAPRKCGLLSKNADQIKFLEPLKRGILCIMVRNATNESLTLRQQPCGEDVIFGTLINKEIYN